MASIRKRIAKGCVNVSFQVQLRRKGFKSLTISFCTYEEAIDWVYQNEKKFIEKPESYDYLRQEYRNLRREREFKMKKMKNYVPRKKPSSLNDELQNFHEVLLTPKGQS